MRGRWPQELAREDWEYDFGPPAAPVRVCAVSEELQRAVLALQAVGTGDSNVRSIVVEGGAGSGKSLLASAFQAMCQTSGLEPLIVHPAVDLSFAMRQSTQVQAIAVDGLDLLPTHIRRTIFSRRLDATHGSLITATQLDPHERESLCDSDILIELLRLESRPKDLVAIAATAWSEVMGTSSGLLDILDEDAMSALCGGPWINGARSLRHAITLIADDQHSKDRPVAVGRNEVLSAIVATVQQDYQPTDNRSPALAIVVEGTTDVVHLETARLAADSAWGTAILSGCEILAAGRDREGGANAVIRELMQLQVSRPGVIGLLDYDDPGRAAQKDAKKFSLNVRLLPWDFDPLRLPRGNGEVEIEDLLPVHLIEQFYTDNSDYQPEATTIRGTCRRVVVKGEDKYAFAEWTRRYASFEQLAKLVWLLCDLRRRLGLPLSELCPNLETWRDELTAPQD